MVEKEYAKALFELAAEKSKEERYLDFLNAVCTSIQEEPEFLKILTAPLIELEEKKRIIKNVYHAFDLDFLSFLNLLISNNRFHLIEVIKNEYQDIFSFHQNILNIEVVSSEKLSKKKLAAIVSNLEEKYPSKKLVVENKVNPDILYGIQIYCNGESLDMSIKNMLAKMKDSL